MNNHWTLHAITNIQSEVQSRFGVVTDVRVSPSTGNAFPSAGADGKTLITCWRSDQYIAHMHWTPIRNYGTYNLLSSARSWPELRNTYRPLTEYCFSLHSIAATGPRKPLKGFLVLKNFRIHCWKTVIRHLPASLPACNLGYTPVSYLICHTPLCERACACADFSSAYSRQCHWVSSSCSYWSYHWTIHVAIEFSSFGSARKHNSKKLIN